MVPTFVIIDDRVEINRLRCLFLKYNGKRYIMSIEWKTEYNLNIAEIDEQHQKLISLISDMLDVTNRDDDFDHYDEIVAIFDELSDYTVKHFAFEEELLNTHNYSSMDMKIHELEHSSFVRKVVQIRQQDLDKNEQGILKDTIQFLLGWIGQHILDTDQKYAQFLIERGVK